MDFLFIEDSAPNVVNQETFSEPPQDELDSDVDVSAGSSGPAGKPSITSRLSLLKVGSMVCKFTEFKKKLIRETGFDGMLQIKSWKKVNLKYSAYLMDRVDEQVSTINLEGQGMLELTESQVHYVFGVPHGEQTIGTEGVEPSEACIEFTRVAASISEKGTHSIKAAEAYLNHNITENSSMIEQDCFKIAFVIFVVGHVLAPSSKNDYITIDFWPALNDPTKLKTWNWCGYILKHLHQAVRKFKADVSKRNPTIHIIGCHLFLQVLVLDSLELGALNKPREVSPRESNDVPTTGFTTAPSLFSANALTDISNALFLFTFSSRSKGARPILTLLVHSTSRLGADLPIVEFRREGDALAMKTSSPIPANLGVGEAD